jgi:hypothetical protein
VQPQPPGSTRAARRAARWRRCAVVLLAVAFLTAVDAVSEAARTPDARRPRSGLVKRPRPPGLAASVGIRIGGGQSEGFNCRGTAGATVSVGSGVVRGSARIGAAVGICFTGFDVRRPLAVSITRPDGTRVRRTLGPAYVEEPDPFAGGPAAARSYQLRLAALPPLAVGRYVVEASQSRARAQASFRLLPQAARTLWVVPEVDSDTTLFRHPDVRPGEPVRLVLTGFPPAARVPIHVYGGRNGEPDGYVTTVVARTDADGYASLRIATGRADRDSQFCPVPAAPFRDEPSEHQWCRGHWFTIGDPARAGRR